MKTNSRKTPVIVDMPQHGVSAFTSRHAPSFRMPQMRNAFHKICLVEEGSGRLCSDDGDTPLVASNLVRIPPRLQHCFADNAETPMTLSVLCVNENALDQPPLVHAMWTSLLHRWPACHVHRPPNTYQWAECQRLFRAIVVELGQRRLDRAAMIHGLVICLLTLMERIVSEPPLSEAEDISDGFAASLAYLNDHFAEPVRVGDLAKRAGLSYRTYTERFRRTTQTTVNQYLNDRRVEFAQRRILETGDIVGSAYEAGFGDISHFYRTFKRLTGETPQAFLKRNLPSATV